MHELHHKMESGHRVYHIVQERTEGQGTDMQIQYKAAVFDMDGTILDTIEDLACAINAAMKKYGYRHDFSREEACLFVGSGAKVAMRRALALALGAAPQSLEMIGTQEEVLPAAFAALPPGEEERLEQAFRAGYPRSEKSLTQPYPGILDLLADLRAAGVKTAVVSNKPDIAAQALAVKMFAGLFDVVIGEQAGIRRKPAPDMVLLALKKMGVQADEAVYIGDSEIDLQTAQAAGMACISAGWGYRPVSFLRSHGARLIAGSAGEVLELMGTAPQDGDRI